MLADARGVVVLDARVRVSASAPGGAARFAITPYPQHLAEAQDWDGQPIVLRPIRPEDEPQHAAFVGRLSAQDLQMRFFHTRRHIGHAEMARLTQIDYEREMAFIAVAPGADGTEETWGVARGLCDPDGEEAEFAVIVRSDLKGHGLGERLMRKLIAHLAQRGVKRVVGEILAANARMLDLARSLGFVITRDPQDPDIRRAVLELAGGAAEGQPAPATSE